MEASYKILKELKHPLGEKFFDNIGTIRKLQSARNNSILAHGYSGTKKETYIKLKDFIISLILINNNGIFEFPVMK